MAANDTKLKIKDYLVDLGLRTISVNDSRDIVPYHELKLTAVSEETGQQVNITIEFWTDLKQFAPTELGFYTAPGTIVVKAPMGEFDRAYDLLRNEKPVFFVFNQFNIEGPQNTQRKSITAVSIVTGKAIPGAGE